MCICRNKNRVLSISEQKGFTLAELLIVVAIIAVLVAISIPIFTTQLEKSREATDLANVRSAYAMVRTSAMTDSPVNDSVKKNGNEYTVTVNLKQKKDGWQSNTNALNVGGITPADNLNWVGTPKGEGTCKISCDTEGNTVINWDASLVNMKVSEEKAKYQSSLNAILNALKTEVVDERLKNAGRHVSYIQINHGKVTQVSYYTSESDIKGNTTDYQVDKAAINQRIEAAIADETYRVDPNQDTASRIFFDWNGNVISGLNDDGSKMGIAGQGAGASILLNSADGKDRNSLYLYGDTWK